MVDEICFLGEEVAARRKWNFGFPFVGVLGKRKAEVAMTLGEIL